MYARTVEYEYSDILNMVSIFVVQVKAEAIVNDMKDTIAFGDSLNDLPMMQAANIAVFLSFS